MTIKLNLQNKLINGAFDYWQRNTTFANATNVYTADRWFAAKTGSMQVTISRSTDVPAQSSSLFSYLATVTTAQPSLAASDLYSIEQRIEGSVLRSFKGKKLVLTFWVKSNKTGTYSVALRNNANDRSFVASYSISSANTWERKTIRLNHDATGSWLYNEQLGMRMNFVIAAGSSFNTTAGLWQAGNFISTSSQVNAADTISNTFQLDDVMLAEDSEGQLREPEFQFAGRDVFEELQLCQRYYEVGLVSSSSTASSSFSRWCSTYKVTKRISSPSVSYTIITGNNATAPTVIVSNEFGAAGSSNGGAANDWTAWTFRADAEI